MLIKHIGTRKVNDFSHLEKTHVALVVSLRKLLEDPDQRNSLYDGIVQSAKKKLHPLVLGINSSVKSLTNQMKVFDEPSNNQLVSQ